MSLLQSLELQSEEIQADRAPFGPPSPERRSSQTQEPAPAGSFALLGKPAGFLYTRKKLENMLNVSEDEKFKIASFTFDRFSSEPILEFLERQAHFGEEKARNVHRFFSEVGLISFDISKRRESPENEAISTIRSNHCWSDVMYWDCHICAGYAATKIPEWSKNIFGFVDQKHPWKKTGEVHTLLHSFNANDQLEFIDPSVEARCRQEMWWAERHKWDKPRVVFEDFSSYTGVIIPLNVVNDILYPEPDRYIGPWRYFNRKIFIDREKTEWFIYVVKNDGQGWIYEGPPE